jgi:hypothetical protein
MTDRSAVMQTRALAEPKLAAQSARAKGRLGIRDDFRNWLIRELA